MAFTINDADMAPSTAESSTAGTTLAFSPTSTVAAGKLAVVLAVFDTGSVTDEVDSTHGAITDSKGNTWTRAKECTNGAGGGGLAGGVYYSVITTQIETSDTITLTIDSSQSGKGVTLASFNFGAGNTISVAGASTGQVGAATSYSETVSGLDNEEHLWIGFNGAAMAPGAGANGRDSAYTAITQGGGAEWGTTGHCSAGGYLIETSTTQTYDNTSLQSIQRVAALVAFKETAAAAVHGTATPATIALTMAVSSAAGIDASAGPDTIPMTMAMPEPSADAGDQTVAPDTIPLTVAMPSPSSVGGDATVAPETIALTVGIGNPFLQGARKVIIKMRAMWQKRMGIRRRKF